LYYASSIIKNHELLDEHDIHHEKAIEKGCAHKFKWVDFASSERVLMVLANEQYWKAWNGLQSAVVSLVSKLSQLGISCVLAQTPDYDFRKQKGAQKTYCPALDSNVELIPVWGTTLSQ
jgi:hypothetical protein